MKPYFYLLLCCLGFHTTKAQLNVNFNPIPNSFGINSAYPVYALDIPYDNIDTSQQAFHLFLPDTTGTFPLVIFIHGGGFLGGSRNDYSNSDVKYFLDNNIAYASFDYRLLPIVGNDNEGVIKCLNDSKYALQFVRYYANDLHINPNQVALYGGSAGAGTSLWLGTRSDMADPNASDPILQMSTRVCAVATSGSQSTYDLYKWDTLVYHNFDGLGTNYTVDSMVNLLSFQRFSNFYGGLDSNYHFLYDPMLIQYRQDVDMLYHMSSDDAPICVSSSSQAVHPSQDLFHHSFHAREIINHAIAAGISEVKAIVPYLGINTSNGESRNEFLNRHVSSCSLTTNTLDLPTPTSTINIYPNPAHQTLYIESEWENPPILIHNAMGQQVYIGYGNEINLSKFQAGVYFITIQSAKPMIFIKE